MNRRFKGVLTCTLLLSAQPIMADWESPLAWWRERTAARAYQQGNYAQAADILSREQVNRPFDPTLNFNLGVTQYKLGEYHNAAANFDRAADQSPAGTQRQNESLVNSGRSWHQKTLGILGDSWEKRDIPAETLRVAADSIREAIQRYSKVLAIDATHQPATEQKQEAEQLLAKIEEKLKQQEQQDKDKDDKNKDQQDQQDQDNKNQQDKQKNKQDQQQQNKQQQSPQQDKQEGQQQGDSKNNQEANKRDGDNEQQNRNGQQDQKQQSSQNQGQEKDQSQQQRPEKSPEQKAAEQQESENARNEQSDAEQPFQEQQDAQQQKSAEQEKSAEQQQADASERTEQEAVQQSAIGEETGNQQAQKAVALREGTGNESLEQKRMRAVLERLQAEEAKQQKAHIAARAHQAAQENQNERRPSW